MSEPLAVPAAVPVAAPEVDKRLARLGRFRHQYSLSETDCWCDGDYCSGYTSGGGGCSGPSPSTGLAMCCATVYVVSVNVAGGQASEALFAAVKHPIGDEVDAAATPFPNDCGTSDKGGGTGVPDGGRFSYEAAASPPAAHPTSATASRRSSFLALTAAAAPSPEEEAAFRWSSPVKMPPLPASFQGLPFYCLPVYPPLF